MKLICMLTLLASLLSFGAYAEDMNPDGSDGCGLGWSVYADKTLVGTTIRSTVNYLVPSQTSGMTSGTSNCAKHDIVKKDKAPLYFTESNYENLVAEMAEGKGQFLNEYANVLGCKNVEEFGAMTQKKFMEILPTEETNAVNMYKNVKEQIRNEALNCAV